jgi:hypothetical protein
MTRLKRVNGHGPFGVDAPAARNFLGDSAQDQRGRGRVDERPRRRNSSWSVSAAADHACRRAGQAVDHRADDPLDCAAV